jgi:hypothetical protein
MSSFVRIAAISRFCSANSKSRGSKRKSTTHPGGGVDSAFAVALRHLMIKPRHRHSGLDNRDVGRDCVLEGAAFEVLNAKYEAPQAP